MDWTFKKSIGIPTYSEGWYYVPAYLYGHEIIVIIFIIIIKNLFIYLRFPSSHVTYVNISEVKWILPGR